MTVQDERHGTSRRSQALGHGWQPRPPIGHAALDLIAHARACLAESASFSTANERFAAAHLAALRAAAAVLAARARPVERGSGKPARRRGHGPRNVWELLPGVAPELSEWSAYFGANAGKRAAAQAGLRGAVTDRDADDLLREAEVFLGLVCVVVGVPYQAPLTGTAVALGGYRLAAS